MKRTLSSVCGGAAVLLLLTGCDPDLAQVPAGSQEELWYRQLKDNYLSFTPPPTPAPAAYNRQAAPQDPVSRNAEKPADDPEKAVDRAAAGENVELNIKENGKDRKDSAEAAPAKDEKKDAETAVPAKDEKKGADALPEKEGKKAAETAAGKAPETAAGKPYIVKSGDTLGGIARQFYGKSSMDDVIFKANSKVIQDRNKLSPGMRLIIPEL